MAITERYVRSDAAGGGDGTTDTNSGANGAYTWAEMVTAINGGAHAGYRYNVKSGTYTLSASSSISGDGTTVSPLVIRGFNSSIGDLESQGRSSTGELNTTNFPVIAYDSTYNFQGAGADRIILANLKFTGNVSGYLVATGLGALTYRCYIENASTNGSAGGIYNGSTRSFVIDSDVNMSGGSGTSYAITCATNDRVIGCRIINAPSTGIDCTADGIVVAHCVFDSVGGDAIKFSSASTSHIPPLCLNNTIYTAGGDGISVANIAFSYPLIALNNHVTDCSAYAFKNEGSGTRELSIIVANNRTRDNTSGVFSGFADWSSGTTFNHVTTDTGGPETDFTDGPGGDFQLIDAAPGYATGMIPYQDIGAIQHQDPVGGGGGGGQRVIGG